MKYKNLNPWTAYINVLNPALDSLDHYLLNRISTEECRNRLADFKKLFKLDDDGEAMIIAFHYVLYRELERLKGGV